MAPDEVQFFPHPKFFNYRKDIDWLAFVRQALHCLKDPLVAVYIKTFRLKDFYNRVKSTLFQHDGTKHGFLQVFCLGWHLAIDHCAEVRTGFSSVFFIPVEVSKIHISKSKG